MKLIKKYGTAVLGLILIGLLVGFTEQRHAQRQVQRVEVVVHPAVGGLFTTPSELLEHLDSETDSFRGIYLEEINSGLLEEKLSAHPMVQKAEVYFDWNGVLYLEVSQREPILRFFDGEEQFYWDEEGEKMPLSEHYTAHVPLFYGAPSDTAELYDLVMALRADEFCCAHISGISEEGEDYVFTARKGRHRIVLGSANQFEEKMERLQLFYEKTIPQVGWNKYSTVNLKYAGQVVCSTN